MVVSSMILGKQHPDIVTSKEVTEIIDTASLINQNDLMFVLDNPHYKVNMPVCLV